ncbi:aspartate/glutamate racemase family protein [Microbacterium sp. NPDC091662]|uniref:aspartate/glutamate racemase family protein n=1 Tax=Microbacterium sp. NPDC091662 TaxID=3364211 RepID=UPI003826700A
MKTIGVLGGMSWESSLEWYRLANERVRNLLGGHHSARILLDSLDFAEIEQMQARDDWEAAGALLADRARALEGAGAEVLVLCTNTMHLVADRIQAAVRIPFLHIADVAAEAIAAAGVQTIGLLGTAFTMERPFYAERLATHGIRTIVPDGGDRAAVHAIIYDELVHGRIREESRRRYVEVIQRLVERGAEGIVLGCTEIELLVSASDAPVPVFPTTALHVDAAVSLALTETGHGPQ